MVRVVLFLFCLSSPYTCIVQCIGIHLKFPAVAYIFHIHCCFKAISQKVVVYFLFHNSSSSLSSNSLASSLAYLTKSGAMLFDLKLFIRVQPYHLLICTSKIWSYTPCVLILYFFIVIPPLIILSVYSLGNNPSEKFINASTFPRSIS